MNLNQFELKRHEKPNREVTNELKMPTLYYYQTDSIRHKLFLLKKWLKGRVIDLETKPTLNAFATFASIFFLSELQIVSECSTPSCAFP